MNQIAGEIIAELGIGAAASTFIPIGGAFITAGLAYAIATRMTHRVGRMVAIYYQNGGTWVGNRKDTYNLAKELPEDLSQIRKNPCVQKTMLRNINSWIESIKKYLSKKQMKYSLKSDSVPEDLINEALSGF